MKKSATSHDVARLAGVSQSTVSRVFRSGAKVSQTKKSKILKAAAKIGYRPNAMARGLITRKSGLIGIILRSLQNPYYPLILEQFQQSLAKSGYHLIFINTYNETIDQPEISRLLEYNVEGVIITDALLTSSAAATFRQLQIPVIFFNRSVKSIPTNSVCCDNYSAAKQMAFFLQSKNLNKFAFLSGPFNTSTAAERLRGFRQGLKNRGIRELIVLEGEYNYDSGYQLANALFSENKKIEAIFCANDILAIGAINAIREKGLQVPHDISIVGFDNIPMAAWPDYSLTTWEQPVDEMVARTLSLLYDEISLKKKKSQKIIVKGKLVIRGSVRA